MPVSDEFTRIKSRGGIGAPIPPATELPSYVSGQAVGTWGTIPTSTLSTSGVMETNGDRVITAWGGAVVNTVGIYVGATFIAGTFLVIWGGGHADYSGNEYYAYGPLDSDTRQWYKPRNPTSPAPENVNVDGSGNPVSRHTYSALAYVGGARNWMLACGTIFRYSDSSGGLDINKLDFNTASPNTNNPWSTLAAMSEGGAITCAYDSAQDRIWANANAANNAQYYDVAANTWTSQNFKSPAFGSDPASAVDTALGIWAIMGSSGINFYRTNNGAGNDYYTPTTSGTAPTTYESIIYDPVAAAFKVWSNEGKKLFTLTPPGSSPYQGGNAWVWSSVTPGTGDTPSAANANGTFGRFNYVGIDTARIYILLNAASESIYFYREA